MHMWPERCVSVPLHEERFAENLTKLLRDDHYCHAHRTHYHVIQKKHQL